MRRLTSRWLIVVVVVGLTLGLAYYIHREMNGAPPLVRPGQTATPPPNAENTLRTSPRDPEYTKQIKQLESADIHAEVAAAVAKSDLRFVAVMGEGLSVPGIPDDQQYKMRYREVPNTSDCIDSDEHMRLQEVAWSYAEKYNQALLKWLKSQPGQ